MRAEYKLPALRSFLEKEYGINDISSIERFESGIENSNFHIISQNQQYVLKIYEELPLSARVFEVAFLKECENKGLPVQKVFITTKGEDFGNYKGKPCILLDYLEGEIIEKVKLNPELMADVGRVLGEFDKRTRDFKYPNANREHFWDAKQFLINEKFLVHVKGIDKGLLRDVIKEYRKIQPKIKKLRTGIIHNDFNQNNVLVKNNKVSGIIDFGDAIDTILVADVVIPIAMQCFLSKEPMKLAKALFESYLTIFPLTQEEKEVIYPLVRARFATGVLYCSWMNATWGKHDDFDWFINWGKNSLLKIDRIGKDRFNHTLGITRRK